MSPREFAETLKARALGEKAAVTSAALRVHPAFAGVNDRAVRELASAAAEAGLPVIGGPRGYFYARTRKEAEAAIARLESHAKAELHHAAVLKRILDAPGQGLIWEGTA